MSVGPQKHRDNQGDTVLMLIKLFVVLCLFIFIMAMSESSIKTLFVKPTYSEDQLIAMTEERKRIRSVERANNRDLIEDGIHVRTGLIDDINLEVVIQNCTSCHSAQLITQNRATRQGWQDMIRWMQKSQGLADLGIYEPKILDYLSTHYAPQKIGRRQNLNTEEIEWYVLDLGEGEK